MKTRRAFSITCIIAVAVLLICFAFVPAASAENRDIHVKVMTRNMDPGVDPAAVALAETQADFEAAIAGIIQSNIPERAKLMAAEIAQTKPDLVALQEATIWKIELMSPVVEYDQLNLLQYYLQKFGQHYKVAAIQKLTAVELPGVLGYTDRNVILVRSDLPPDQLYVSRPETHLYQALMSFPVSFQTDPLSVLRGWMSVDVKIQGSRFKFVTTHLEAPLPGIDVTKDLQFAQAMQLMEDLEDVKLPIIMAGDFNSDAEHTNNYPPDNTGSYDYIVGSKFSDAWDELRPNNPGFTWSLYPVAGIDFAPFERIDLAFSNGPEAVSIMRTGLNKVNGLYASDHAGVVAVFDLMNQHPSHHGTSPIYQNFPKEYPGCHLPADIVRYFHRSGFRRH
jgi:endonuclease/exonuclease/phosphatase family metal-dependent hydrolase